MPLGHFLRDRLEKEAWLLTLSTATTFIGPSIPWINSGERVVLRRRLVPHAGKWDLVKALSWPWERELLSPDALSLRTNVFLR